MNSQTVRLYAAALLALSVAAIPQVGLAAMPVTYNGIQCHGKDNAEQAKLSPSGNHISVTSDAEVVCPIIKTTSGPGIWDGDEISNVTVSFAASSVATCWLTIYSANEFGDEGSPGSIESNVMEQSSGSISSSSISLSSTTVSYWNGYEDHHTWYYPELYCDISSGTLNSYSVTEAGTVQDYDRIAPASNCANASAGSYNFYGPGSPVTYSPSYDLGVWGGYVQAASPESGFSMVCPVLTDGGSAIEIAVGHTISAPTTPPNLMGCETTDTSAWQYADYDAEGEMPPQVLTYTQSTPSALICQMENLPSIGDGKVFSYRTAENTSDFTLE